MKKAEEKKNLRKELERCQKEREEYLAGWKRTRADFLNYKKEERERAEKAMKFVNEELILKILPILDNFDLIEKKLPENLKNDDNVVGILQLKRQIWDFLKNEGVEKIKAVGERFDPNFHEVVEEIEKKDRESGIIIEEVKGGYKLHNKIIRPSRVKVSK